MWCVPKLNREFIDRMESLLELYQKPYDPSQPVVCFDEKSKQLLKDTKPMQLTRPGKPRRRDYEYERNGTKNLFVAVEAKGGFRQVTVTDRRTARDFAREIKSLLNNYYQRAKKVHLVLDNLNTHFEKSFLETFPKTEAERLLKHLEFHYTPKHASWLNMAEIEIGILDRQCLKGRIPDTATMVRSVSAWQKYRNDRKATINWKFSVADARKAFRYQSTKLT